MTWNLMFFFNSILLGVGLFQQSLHGLSGLCAGLDPSLCTLGVHLDGSGLLQGIIGADLFDETAVAGIPGVGNHDTIEGVLLGAHSAKSDLNHVTFTSK